MIPILLVDGFNLTEIIFFFGLAFGIYIFMEKLLPRFKKNSIPELIIRFSPVNIMIALILYILVDSPIQQDFQSHGILYVILFTRLGGIANGAHTVAYLLIPTLFFLTAFLAFKEDWIRASFYTGLMVFVHEIVWFGLYYIFYWSVLDVRSIISGDSGFIALTLVAVYVYRKRYGKFPVSLKAATGIYVWFVGIWGLIGFPVTILADQNNGVNVFHVTQFWANWNVNGMEFVSWALIFTGFLVSAVYERRHTYKTVAISTS